MGYQGSEEHKENARNVSKIGNAVFSENARIRRELAQEEYLKNPKKCRNCDKPLDFEKKVNQFCSRRCSAITSNSHRPPPSKEQRLKTSNTMKGKKFTEERWLNQFKKYTNIIFKNCCTCENPFVVSHRKFNTYHKTCSTECGRILGQKRGSYPNGKRPTIYYTNKTQGEIVLESTWELKIAKLLDSLRIEWIRPKHIPWVDSTGKKRNYFPDFYLPKYDMYLDPKNKYCMKLDEEKMGIISKKVKIEYGEVTKIENYIRNLEKVFQYI